MSLREKYKTDAKLEKEGVWFNIDGKFKVKAKRPGGANRDYKKAIDRAVKPYRRLLIRGSTDATVNEALDKATIDVWSKTVIVDWEGAGTHDLGRGLAEEDRPLPYTPEDFVAAMEEYPDLWDLVKEHVGGSHDPFREDLEEEAKN